VPPFVVPGATVVIRAALPVLPEYGKSAKILATFHPANHEQD
jgi:hypothetical protein